MTVSNRFQDQLRTALPGSEREPFPSETNTPPPLTLEAGAESEVTVSVLLRRKEALSPAESVTRMTREELAERHGADEAASQLVHDFALEFGMRVERGPGSRTLHLSGSVSDLEKAFGVTLTQGPGGLRTRTGPILLPEKLVGPIEAVLGLDNRPQAVSHLRVAKPRVANVSYTPVQVAHLYGFPTTGAAGQTIGIIELGGGFRPADITAYFASIGVTAPSVTAVAVDKGKNTPGNASGADGEVMLDIEVAAAVAAGVKIVVYFAPNTDQGFTDAITQAVNDTTHKPSVISISWGGPESSWTKQAMTAMDSACQAAAAVGVTITVASGDNGSGDGVSTGNHVDFPASSPHVLACGGTKLVGSGTKITSEVVWNETAANEGATGGGVSAVFAKPSWQSGAKVPTIAAPGGRGVPDVAGDADPATGYTIRVDGQTSVIGGTSAVAPLWAGLLAVANAANGRSAGFVNPVLYANPNAFRDITSGNNGAFAAAAGWDPCTGLGSPVGSAVVSALKTGVTG